MKLEISPSESKFREITHENNNKDNKVPMADGVGIKRNNKDQKRLGIKRKTL